MRSLGVPVFEARPRALAGALNEALAFDGPAFIHLPQTVVYPGGDALMDLALTPELVEIQQRSRRFCDEHLLPVELECELEGGLPPEALERVAARRARGAAARGQHAARVGRPGLQLARAGDLAGAARALDERALGRRLASRERARATATTAARALPAARDPGRAALRLRGHRARTPGRTRAGSQTRATRTPGGWRIDGEKWFVTAADVADYLIVVADAEGHGPTAFLVDQGTPGLRETRRPRYMHTFVYEHPEYVLEGCEVADDQVLGGLGQGHELSREWFIEERLMIAARCLGGAERALEIALAYALRARAVRRSAIVDFQGVSFPLASSAVELAAARALDLPGGVGGERGPRSARRCTRRPRRSSSTPRDGGPGRDRCVQVLGGRGYMRENPVRAPLPRPARRPDLGGDVRDPAVVIVERARQARPRHGHRVARVVRPSVERERRVQLTAAAARVIARKGYEAATLRDVADEAGTSTGTLNYYYHGKDELFAATLRAASERFQTDLAGAVAAASSPRDQLVAMARAATPAAPGRSRGARTLDRLLGAGRAGRVAARAEPPIYDRWRSEIASIVREGQAGGSFVRSADPDAFARGYAAVIDGLATHVVLHDGLGPAEMEAACSAYVEAALGTLPV